MHSERVVNVTIGPFQNTVGARLFAQSIKLVFKAEFISLQAVRFLKIGPYGEF